MPEQKRIIIWMPIVTAVIAACMTGAFGYYFRYLEVKEKTHNEIMQERKKALFQALTVIDNIYANTKFSGLPTLPRKEWDIQIARDAYNKILIYSEKPEKTAKAFTDAVGLFNPMFEKPKGYNAATINQFRKEIARELELPEMMYVDSTHAWIAVLPGTKEETYFIKQKRK